MNTPKRIAALLLWMGAFLVVLGPLEAAEPDDGPLRARAALNPVRSQVLRSRVSRPVTVLFVAPVGTIVKKGDLLVELDASDLTEQKLEQEMHMSQARAELAAAEEAFGGGRQERTEGLKIAEQALALAEMALKGFLEGQYPLELAQAEAEMVLAKEKLDVAASRASYVEKVAEAGAERELALKEARVERLESELQVKAAKDRIRFLKDVHLCHKKAELQLGVSRRKLELIHAKNQLSRAAQQSRIAVEAARERYELERTRLQRLKEQIGACRIRAPQAGTLRYSHETWGRRGETTSIRPGIVVCNRQPLLEIMDAEHFKLQVPVSADVARRVETGEKVTVRVDAVPSRTYEGRVAEVGPLPRPRGSARNLIVVHLDDSSGDLRVGMSAMLEFED